MHPWTPAFAGVTMKKESAKTTNRHARESGHPVGTIVYVALDPRFRGGDDERGQAW